MVLKLFVGGGVGSLLVAHIVLTSESSECSARKEKHPPQAKMDTHTSTLHLCGAA